MSQQRGFTVIEGLLIIIVVLLMSGAGYYVFSKQKNDTNIDQYTASEVANSRPVGLTEAELIAWAETKSPRFLNNGEGSVLTFTNFKNEDSSVSTTVGMPAKFYAFLDTASLDDVVEYLKKNGFVQASAEYAYYEDVFLANDYLLCQVGKPSVISTTSARIVCSDQNDFKYVVNDIRSVVDAIERIKGLEVSTAISFSFDNRNTVNVYYRDGDGVYRDVIYLKKDTYDSEWILVKEVYEGQ